MSRTFASAWKMHRETLVPVVHRRRSSEAGISPASVRNLTDEGETPGLRLPGAPFITLRHLCSVSECGEWSHSFRTACSYGPRIWWRNRFDDGPVGGEFEHASRTFCCVGEVMLARGGKVVQWPVNRWRCQP